MTEKLHPSLTIPINSPSLGLFFKGLSFDVSDKTSAEQKSEGQDNLNTELAIFLHWLVQQWHPVRLGNDWILIDALLFKTSCVLHVLQSVNFNHSLAEKQLGLSVLEPVNSNGFT